MISALFKAFEQLRDPKLKRVLKLGLAGALATYAILVGLAWWGLSATTLFMDPWAETSVDVAGVLVALILPVLFFPAIVTSVMSPWLEQVADAVEERHYPALNWPRPQKWTEVLANTLKFLLVIVAVNALALPVYLTLLIFGISIPIAFLINGYLLGREYFELVAFRRLLPAEAKLLFRNRLGRMWTAGIIIYFLFTIPILNLAAPVIATAFMVHLFQSLRPNTEGL